MAANYVEPRGARHRIEFVDGTERLRIPMRRNWFVILFLSFWLTAWTFGGAMAAAEFARTGDNLLAVWLVGWAFGWLFAGSMIGLQLGGAETIRVVGGDLEHGFTIGPIRRVRRYRGSQIVGLRAADPGGWFESWFMRQGSHPLLSRLRRGSVKFDYGAQTIYLAPDVDESEGKQIVEWLKRRLPGVRGQTE